VAPERTASPANLPETTRLAVERTRLAYERTLMAWVRTSTALISFGFTIYKFFQFLRESGEARPDAQLLGPRQFAMLMIIIGLGALVAAALQHWHDVSRLREQYGVVRYSLAAMLAVLVGGLGILGLLAVIFRQ
jgi:putative membrane protein